MASVTPDQALRNGWIITNDGAGNTVYLDSTGNVIDPDTSSTVANINRTSASDASAGFDFWTAASDLLKQGMSIYQLNQQQQAFLDVNKQRAASGQTPLPWSSFQPTASVGLTADPKILWVAIGVALILGLGLFGRRR